MRYGNVDTFLERFPIKPGTGSIERYYIGMEANYRSTVNFLLRPIKLESEKEKELRSRIDKIIKLLSTNLSKEQIELNTEWINIHIEHDDVIGCYNNYTKEYQTLENKAMQYLQINDGADELEFFTNSKKLNTILDQLCNIRYRKSILEEYLKEPPDLA